MSEEELDTVFDNIEKQINAELKNAGASEDAVKIEKDGNVYRTYVDMTKLPENWNVNDVVNEYNNQLNENLKNKASPDCFSEKQIDKSEKPAPGL